MWDEGCCIPIFCIKFQNFSGGQHPGILGCGSELAAEFPTLQAMQSNGSLNALVIFLYQIRHLLFRARVDLTITVHEQIEGRQGIKTIATHPVLPVPQARVDC